MFRRALRGGTPYGLLAFSPPRFIYSLIFINLLTLSPNYAIIKILVDAAFMDGDGFRAVYVRMLQRKVLRL